MSEARRSPGGRGACLVITTCPDEVSARAIARGLVECRLAACVHLLPVRSVFRWQGVLEEEAELALHIKSRTARVREIERYLDAHHPYEVPELLVLPVDDGGESYLAWIGAETDGP